ncbi:PLASMODESMATA CALLOSE-BINDING PROTEIN 1-like [Primulina huaijiensis]|uniref:PLASMODESMATA CALLOSE-BINDING PROTEIN 1-like n=1 Tax=Primulina huaijiensis TaxID=1492673 RepID=UPI003CC73CA5
MAVYVVCLLLLLAMVGFSDATYCLCNTASSNTVLQQNIDYACGNGADCSAILQNGACFLPNTAGDHCNYAVNSYYQRKGQINGSCDFKGSAMVSPTPPSNLAAGCVYQSSPSNGNSTAPPFSPGGTPPNAPPGSGSFGPPGSGSFAPPGSFVPPSGFDNGSDVTLLSRSVTTSILACFSVDFLIYGLVWQRI